MSKKQLNAFKRELRLKMQGRMNDYALWKQQIYTEPNGFLVNSKANVEALTSLLPKDATTYFEQTDNNPLLPDSHVKITGMMDWWTRANQDMLQYAPEFLENLKDRYAKDNSQLLFMYYWLLLDGGVIDTKRLLCQQLFPKSSGLLRQLILKPMIGAMVRESLTHLILNKKDWNREIRQEKDVDTKGAMVDANRTTIVYTNKGREDVDVQLTDLFVENHKQKVYEQLKFLVEQRTSDTDLGVMLYALTKAQCVVECSYATFHRALQREFPDANIGLADRPQKLYGKLMSGLTDTLKERHRTSVEALYQSYFTAFAEANS